MARFRRGGADVKQAIDKGKRGAGGASQENVLQRAKGSIEEGEVKTSKWWVIVGILACAILVFGAVAWSETTTTCTLPSAVYRPAEFVASSTTTNSGTTYTHVKFIITVSGPVDFTGDRADTFTITKVNGNSDPESMHGINSTFELVGGDWVGYWGPAEGFPLSDPYNATSTFTIQMCDVSTAPLGDYDVTVELVDLDSGSAVLATATGSFNLSADALYVGTTEYEYQFTTIQSAIDAASDGDTINVAAGIYAENLDIQKDDLTISGAGKANTVITSPEVSFDAAVYHGLHIWPIVCAKPPSGGVTTVEHLTIDGDSTASIGAGVTGILFHNAGGTVNDCEFVNVNIGILGYDETGATCALTVSNNLVHSYDENGIVLSGENLTADVTSNEVIGPGPIDYTVSVGINVNTGVTGTIINNTCSEHNYNGSDDYAGLGICIYNTSGVIICEDNVVHNNDHGITFYDFDGWDGGGAFRGNEVYNNVVDGIQLGSITGPYEITHNKIYGNGGGGVWVNTAPAGSFISFNSLYDNAGAGIVLEEHEGVMIDATGNWWGDASGPSGVGHGSGDAVAYDNTNYSPWWGENYVEDDHSTPWTWGADDDIQGAIDTANSGDIIYVFAKEDGVYDGGLYIDKDLVLKGVRHDWPVIEGPRNWDEPWNALGIAIEAGHAVEINEFEIRDASNAVAIVGNGENPTNVQVHECRFYGNQPFAVYNFAENWNPANIFNATHNFWDHWTGPYHETENPLGQGDRVGDTVVFDPWHSDWNISTLTTRAWLPEEEWTVPLLPHVYVDEANGEDWYDGTCWVSDALFDDEAGIGPKRSLQSGIAIAAPGGTVHVASGNYDGRGRSLTVNRDVTIEGSPGAYPAINGPWPQNWDEPWTQAGIFIDAGTVNIYGFTIRWATNGILVRGRDDTPEVHLHDNYIYDNGMGIDNWTDDYTDATDNWWGYSSGPYHPVENPGGEGNRVGDNIEFDPWRTDPNISASQAIASHDFPDDGWNLVSVPLDPMDPADDDSVFGDDVGDLEHSLYRYNPATPGYDSGGGLAVLPEYGFWLYLNDAVTIDVAGDDLTGADYETVGLAYGWQQISTPFSTYWKDTMVSNDGGSTWVSLADAVTTNGWIDNAIHQWDAEHQWYETISYAPTDHTAWDLLYLKPWNGYWINNFSDGDLKFKFIYATPPAPTAYSMMAEEQAALWKQLSELGGMPRPPAPPMMPQAAAIAQNIAVMVAPNPVQQGTAVEFRVTGEMASFVNSVTVQVYTIGGQLIFDESTQGRSVMWNLTTLSGKPVANGLYLYVAQMEFIGGETAKFNKLLILK